MRRASALLVSTSILAGCLLAGCAPASFDPDADGVEPTGGRNDGIVDGTVNDAAATTCSTGSIAPLSQQIIDEARCADASAYAPLPAAPNLVVGANVFAYIEEPARDALVAALAANPKQTLTVTSMLRTVAQQYLLYQWYQGGRCGIDLAAHPGKSNHETGLAFDTPDYAAWKGSLPGHGFKWFGSADKPHFDYVGSGASSHSGADVAAFQRLWNRNHPDDLLAEDGAYGPRTEARLAKSPAQGFAKGPSCTPDPGGDPPPDPPPPPATVWTPAPGTTWQWQLSTVLDASVDAAVYDIDGFDNDAAQVQKLHAQGRKVICYVSVGTWEDWRADAGAFPASVLGKDDAGWAGEKWLDIRRIDLLGPVIGARFDMCRDKGFDAIEPDNIDAYTNDTGFPLSYGDQLAYNQWLAVQAHARGLSIGLKNDDDQAKDLVASFDWALTEDCFDQGWCAQMSPFVSAGKAVFAAEYTDTGATLGKFCAQAKSLQFSAILKHRLLDAWIQTCP
jgi:hypothetical protein